MKAFFLCVTVFFVASFAFAASGLSSPDAIDSPIEAMFVPNGFDDNDNVEVILQGRFQDTCYQVGPTSFTIDHENKEVIVEATSYKFDAVLCAQVIVPFLQVVKIGALRNGEYKVSLKHDMQISRSVFVAERTTNNHDDHIYGPIDYAKLVTEGDKQKITLSGTFPITLVGCMFFKEFRKTYTRGQELIVVQPIVDFTTDDNDPRCEKNHGGMKFNRDIPLSKTFTGDGLVHIRVMNGNSLNHFFYGE